MSLRRSISDGGFEIVLAEPGFDAPAKTVNSDILEAPEK